jgi:hypothetical protein
LEEKAQGLKAAAKDKFKQSKFGQKLDEKLDVTKDLGNKRRMLSRIRMEKTATSKMS